MDPYRSVEDDLGALLAEVHSRPLSFFTRAKGDDLRFHEHGLAVVRAKQIISVQWEDIVELRTESPEDGSEEFHLRLRDGALVIRLTKPDDDRTYERLCDGTLARMLAAARGAREKLEFGPIVIEGDELRTEFTSLATARIDDVRTQRGQLIVVGRDRTWIELSIDAIPNAHVLIALLRELRDEREPAVSSDKGETAYSALKRLAEAQQRAPDAVTVTRTYGRRSGPSGSD